jgi:N-acetylmuramate 1-kinase
MADREPLIRAFLARHGWGAASRAPLAGDASFRRYERLGNGRARAVLMDGPPPEDVRPFLRVADLLRRQGLSPPRIHAADIEHGLVLLEDLGDDLYLRVIERGADPRPLYEAAVDLLATLQRVPPPADLPLYDDAWLMREAMLLVEWYRPALATGAKARLLDLWLELLPLARTGPDVIVYRDYHAENLIWLPEREGLARTGLLDFQGAVRGPAAYDLVSLLEDARRDVAPDLAQAMIARYLAARPDLNPEHFRAAYALMGAQRNAKILGLFTRLAERDGKPGYLRHLPRVRGYLERDLAHPALSRLRDWWREHLD